MSERRPISVLFVEDSEDDAELGVLRLKAAGFDVSWRRVASSEEMIGALTEACWDLILCDHRMPGFDSIGALRVLRDSGAEIPLILVSGAIDAEAAVAAVNEGAVDYVSKDRLGQLGGAVDIRLREAEHRRARQLAEEALRESRERFEQAFENAPIGMALVSLGGEWTRVNRALCRITGYAPAELVGKRVVEITHPGDVDCDAEQRRRLVIREIPDYRLEERYLGAGGQTIWVSLSVSLIHGAGGKAPYFIWQLEDITERKHYEEKLRIHAERDTLTGLLNRRRLEEELARAVSENQRYGTPATLLICDLDNLKLVNDTLGHKTGDDLINGVARALSERVRDIDVLARMGGDEFAVLLPHTELGQGQAMGERLRAAVLDLDLLASKRRLHTTLSVGIAPVGDGLSAEDSLVAADFAMYEAKRHGRNRTATSRQAITDDARTMHLGWLERLRGALADGRFELHAQPITNLRSGEVSCFELLLRMRESDGELLMPAAFIPTAERFGAITEIDRWVVREAIRILAADQHANATYTINLSGVSVGDPELLRLIEREIILTGVDPSRLIFEFTETAAINDLSASREFTHGLARIGCASALDDFGSGFGSFTYLKYLPVNYLKIDGEFIRNLPGSTDDRILVKAIVDVAHGLHKQTIAEFVRSDQALELLRAYGVDYAQGFYLGMPQPLALNT